MDRVVQNCRVLGGRRRILRCAEKYQMIKRNETCLSHDDQLTNLYCGMHRIEKDKKKMKIKPVLWQRGESELDLIWRCELHCRC